MPFVNEYVTQKAEISPSMIIDLYKNDFLMLGMPSLFPGNAILSLIFTILNSLWNLLKRNRIIAPRPRENLENSKDLENPKCDNRKTSSRRKSIETSDEH